MNQTELIRIPRSKKGLRLFIIVSGVFVLILCLLLTWILGSFELGTNLGELIVSLAWIFIPLIWAVSSYITWRKWNKSGYFLSSEALIVRRAGIFTATDEIYRYDLIMGVRSRTGLIGGHYGYGTITLDIPKNPRPLILQYVEQPDQIAVQLKNQTN